MVETYKDDKTGQYGWICPKCGRVNVPWSKNCDCCVWPESFTTYPQSSNYPYWLYNTLWC